MTNPQWEVCIATREQDLEARRREKSEWGQSLTMDEFFDREELLASQPFAKEGDGGRRRWYVDYS